MSMLNMMGSFEGVALVQLDIAESCTKPAGAYAVWGKGSAQPIPYALAPTIPSSRRFRRN